VKFLRFLKSWDTLAILFLAVWPLVFYWQVTLGQQVFSEGDLLWLFLPLRTELSRALAEGRLPLWTPALQAGFPLFAEGEVAALYPINLIFHWLFPPAVALSYTILFNRAFASVGMYVLVRSLGMRVPSGLLAGLVFGASAFITAHLSHSPHMAVAAWLPWLVYFQRQSFLARSKKQSAIWFLIAGASVALQLFGGFPQFALFNIGVFNLCALLSPAIWTDATPRFQILARQSARAVMVSVGATILGISLAAVQLVPTAELISLSIRGQEMSKGFFTSYSLEPAALSQFIAPFWYLGRPEAANMEFWGYLGVLPFLLALLAPWWRRDARTKFFLILALVALVLALGGNTPIYDWLYNVPLFNRFRVPARFLVLFTFAAAMLAAIGFDELQRRARASIQIPRGVLSGVALAALASVGFVIYLAYQQSIDFWLDTWRWLSILLIVSALVLIFAHRWLSRLVLIELILAFSLLDLTAFAGTFLTTLTRTSSPSDLMQVSRSVQAMDTKDLLYRSYYIKPPMTDAAIRGILFTNLPLLYGKQGVTGYLPSLAIQRDQTYLDQMTLDMRNLINMRYYLLPLEMPEFGDPLPPWWDDSEPNGGLSIDLLAAMPQILAIVLKRIEITSYTDQTLDLPPGSPVGEIVLATADGKSMTLPLRLGIETADWAIDGFSSTAKHTKPAQVETFPAYLKSIGKVFDGHKYVARIEVGANGLPVPVTAIGAHSFLPVGGLNIEHIDLIDDAGKVWSLASLLGRNDLALVFRSHAVAMWENKSVFPRVAVLHQAEIANDDDALNRLADPAFPYQQSIILSDAPATAALEPLQLGANDSVTVSEYKSERVVVNATTNQRGYLLLTDAWYPGWQAWVDGKESPIYRADYMFRAVPLEPGSHTITFEYHPSSLVWGAVLSGLTLLVFGLIAVWTFR
jgi:hypothetical protein